MTRPKADENRDYRWRIAMKKSDWAKIVYRLAMGIHYCNFKDEVHNHPDQANKNSAYLSVWSAMLRVQHGEDQDYRPNNGQGYFDYSKAWQRELDYASGRFDDLDPVPTKTIRTVAAENLEQALGEIDEQD
jgi:hypothetical protein